MEVKQSSPAANEMVSLFMEPLVALLGPPSLPLTAALGGAGELLTDVVKK